MKYLLQKREHDGIWQNRFGHGHKFTPWKTIKRFVTEDEARVWFYELKGKGLYQYRIKLGKEIIAQS